MDRKLDLLVGELKRYGVSVAGIQETKWFGADVWPAADGCVLLHSGRPVPNNNAEVMVRREGVEILNKRAVSAWRAAGEVWRAINSRLVIARLKWVQRRWQTFQESLVSIVCAQP